VALVTRPTRLERTDNDVGGWRFAAGTDAEISQAWVKQHVLTFQEGFASIGVEADQYFLLPRHGWIGSWASAAAVWSGDIESTFAELALQVKTLQGFAMSGQTLLTTDIGGVSAC
jgi:alpha-D-xyloside xylohydrolase